VATARNRGPQGLQESRTTGTRCAGTSELYPAEAEQMAVSQDDDAQDYGGDAQHQLG